MACPGRGDDWDVFRATLQAPFKGRNQEVTDMLGRLGNNRPTMVYPAGQHPATR